jgi:hypothetical protein
MQEQAISIREYARRRKCSEAAVRRAIADGRISSRAVIQNPNNGRPMILPSLADASWREVIKGNNPRLAESVATGGAPVNAPAGRSLIDIKRMSAEIDLQLKALELKERKGSLLDREQVYSALFSMGKELKQELENIPDRVIDTVIVASNRNEAHSILAIAIGDVLERMSEIIKRDISMKR